LSRETVLLLRAERPRARPAPTDAPPPRHRPDSRWHARDRPTEPPGLGERRARRALQEGVRAAPRAGRRADPRVLTRGAAARRLELPRHGAHPHARLARVPVASEAQPLG